MKFVTNVGRKNMARNIAKTENGKDTLCLILSSQERDFLVSIHPEGIAGGWRPCKTLTSDVYLIEAWPGRWDDGSKIEQTPPEVPEDYDWSLWWSASFTSMRMKTAIRNAVFETTGGLQNAEGFPVLAVLLGDHVKEPKRKPKLRTTTLKKPKKSREEPDTI